jgi:lipid II:glycine glycyltransferase (peptidoglycan interpeptide bridge formation enzyme)
MLLRAIREEERAQFDQLVRHPLQSWAWGDFRKKTGVEVERVGFFENGQLKKPFQIFFHPLPAPMKSMTAGYFPKGEMPDEEQLNALTQLGKRHKALFVKMEPNVARAVETKSGFDQIAQFLQKNGAQPGRPLFTKYTIQLDLTPSEEKLFGQLSSKTRYNVNVAFKKGVQIYENTTKEGMEQYIQILAETTQRQGFYAHTPEYFRTMWETLGNSGMLRIFNAVYEDQVLVCWIMFVFNGTLYYPYGASRSAFREVMPSNLMMWEMIKFGKAQGCTMFDMWGSLGPEPNEKDPWFGFHRFKKGFGGELTEFLGTYDLVINTPIYPFFKIAEDVRWKFLRLKASLKR